ncbi:MAG: TetR/AcrR family transcriptional regulator [Anaeromyxobacter sp.]|nr:TetR/AcrR family transcriptional regulator [Anaeromyxobacter sp.]MBL0276073.1 TetR/AcrR family transcriptional regulator [Anaeromyxobacter sp.]
MTAPRPQRAPPHRVAADAAEPEKRRAILHAAVRVFAEKGYHGCRIADVARAAGVAYGLVYHYFKNKDELLESVFAEQWTILINALRAIDEGPGTSEEKIAGVCGFVLDVYKTAPTAVRVLILEVTRTPNALRAGSTPQTFAAAVGILADLVRRGQAAGELRADVEPVVAAAAVLGALEMTLTGLVMGLVRPPEPSEDELDAVKAQLVGLLLSGLRAPGR